MEKVKWLTPWMKSEVNMKDVVDKLDRNISFYCVALSDVNVQREYDIFYCDAKYVADVVEYILDYDRSFNGYDIEILGVVLKERDDDRTILDIAIGYMDIEKDELKVKKEKPFVKKYAVKNGILYDEDYRMIINLKKKLLS